MRTLIFKRCFELSIKTNRKRSCYMTFGTHYVCGTALDLDLFTGPHDAPQQI